ncbi:MAG: WD40/YVTN/BNR-like repeat-containing protein [Geminicoccaceae bacterium]
MARGTGLAAAVLVAAFLVGPARAQDSAPAPRPAEHLPLVTESLLLDLAMVDDLVIAVGERGHIVRRSADGAVTQAEVPVRALLTALSALADGTLVAVGHDSVVLRSEDAGASWQLVHRDVDFDAPLLDVRFVDNTRGFAVGAYGQLLRSVDGGRTWQRDSLHVDEPHVYHLEVLDDGRLLAVGEFGALLLSNDGGASFTWLDGPYDGTFFTSARSIDGTLCIAGLRGHLFCAADVGGPWRAIDLGTQASILRLVPLETGMLLALGRDGLLARFDPRTGEAVPLVYARRDVLTDARALPGGGWLLASEHGLQHVALEAQPETPGG